MSDRVRVRRVIDGDTIELDREDPTGTYPFERVRLARVSAPELTARNPHTRAAAYAGVAFLETLLLGRDVELEGEAPDKFHRRLARATVYLPTADPRMPGGEPHDVESLLVAYGLARWWTDIVRDRERAKRRSTAPLKR